MEQKVKKTKKRRLALYLDADLARALRMEALRRDKSASAIVENLVAAWLKDQRKGKG